MIDRHDWPAVLDAFEARLSDQLQALGAGGDPTVAAFEPPEMAVPLPDHLVERAQVLVQRSRDIEADLAMALADVETALQRSAQQPTASTQDQQPVYFDSRV